MHKIIVMNAKGGCGKTTIATNLASLYAAHGYNTALFDYDPQGSSSSWLKRRAADAPPIHGVTAGQQGAVSMTRSWMMRLPADTERVIVDTPAAVKGHEAVSYLKDVNTILVPVLASVVDVEASARFVHDLLKMIKHRLAHMKIVVVANRVRHRSPALQVMDELFGEMDIPIVTRLRDSINYLECADLGLGLCDLPGRRALTERRALMDVVCGIDSDFKESFQPTPARETEVATENGSVCDFSFSMPYAAERHFSVSWK